MNLDWQQRAACRHPSITPADFDTTLTDSRGHPNLTRARHIAHRVCGPCPVRGDCLTLAAELTANGYGPQETVWAGMWWPSAKSATPTPIDLLAEPAKDHAA